MDNIQDLIAAMAADKAALTKTCPHCGAELLSFRGACLLESTEGEERARLEQLAMACTCEGAKREEEEIAKAAEQARKERERERRQKIFAESGMPSEWQGRSMKQWQVTTPEQQAAYNAAVAFGAKVTAGKNPGSLFIAGDVGTGKTFLASCLVRDLHRRGVRVTWARVGDILREIKGTFGKRDAEDVLFRYQAAGMLVLDDLGKERPTEWAVEQLFLLIDSRYSEKRPLIVTTNYGAKALVNRLTPYAWDGRQGDDTTARAIVDRLCEMCENVQLKGRSHRQKP